MWEQESTCIGRQNKYNFKHIERKLDIIATPTSMYSSLIIIFQNFWSYRGIRNSQIAIDCSVLTDSVFFVLCAYFDGSMVFFDEFLPYKSWNTVDIIQKYEFF